MSMRTPNGDVVLTGTAQGAGTYRSEAFRAADVILMIHATAVSGTSPTLAVSLEQSNDGSTWTAVPQSAAATVTAVGNSLANATTTQQLCRVVAVIGGTTPAFTYRVAALSFAD